MKKTIFILSILFYQVLVFGQNKGINVYFSAGLLSNSLNNAEYINHQISYYGGQHFNWKDIYITYKDFYNFNLKFEVPTKKDFVDFTFGAGYAFMPEDISFSSQVTPENYVLYQRFNGGNIFVGVSPKLKGKHFGLTSEIRLGYYVYRYFFYYYDSYLDPIINFDFTRETSGLGVELNAGFYIKFWHIGINPNVNYLFTGDSDASFLFWGVNVPLVFYF